MALKKLSKLLIVLLVVIVSSSLSIGVVFAVETKITNYPTSISLDPFDIQLSISGARIGANYLRVDLYREGSSNYFGETYNGSSWYSGSDGSQYFQINIESNASWSGSLQGRMGNPTSTDFPGNGDYKLRVRRYTSSTGYSSPEANESAVSLNITIPTPTFSPTPTSNPTSVPTNTQVPTPTKTPTPAPTATKSISSTPTPATALTSISPAISENLTKNLETQIHFATKEAEFATSSQKNSKSINPKVLGLSSSNFSKIIIIFGVILILIACGILSFKYFPFKFGDKESQDF